MRGFRLGKVADFEISIDWSWLIIFFLVIYSLGGFYFPGLKLGVGPGINWILGTIAAIFLFISVLAHELMHSVVAKRYGIDIKGITLFIFGGMSQTKSEPGTPKAEFWMAIAGPLTSFAIAGMLYAVTYAGNAANWAPPVLALTGYLASINLILAIFNLVPGFPLDGGRVLRSALWSWTDNFEKATRYASYIGQGFGYLLIAFGAFSLFTGQFIGGVWLAFIGWFLTSAAKSSYEQVLMREALSGVGVERVMTTDAPTVSPKTTVDDFVHNYLMREDYPCYPVVEENDDVDGIVSLEEVRTVPQDRWSTTTVEEIAQPVDEELRVDRDDNAWDALLKLASENARRLLVMHGKKLEGTVTQENILRLIRTKMQLGV